MGSIVPGVSLTVVQNNIVILNLRYAVAYRAIPVLWLSGGAADG